jgi:hydrogenase expression/formation protein HypE
VREGLEFETVLESDCAPLHDLARVALTASPSLRVMRDPTRGGLASALCELATASLVGVALDEVRIPLRREVRSACELLGLDPLYVACEGKLVAITPPEESDALLAAWRAHPLGAQAAIVGRVVDDHPRLVTMRTVVGGERVVSMLSGEQLPRIC